MQPTATFRRQWDSNLVLEGDVLERGVEKHESFGTETKQQGLEIKTKAAWILKGCCRRAKQTWIIEGT